VLFLVKVLFLLSIPLTLNAAKEDVWRLRYFLPYSGETEITRNSNKSKVKLKTFGNSGNIILANGVGIGYNTLLKNGNIEGIHYKFKNHSLDLSFTIGDSLCFSFGAGHLIYGRGELTYNGNNFVTEKSKGESFFFDLGFPFIFGEVIIGYRQNFTEYNNFQAQTSEKSFVLEDSVKLFSSQVNAGIGLLF